MTVVPSLDMTVVPSLDMTGRESFDQSVLLPEQVITKLNFSNVLCKCYVALSIFFGRYACQTLEVFSKDGL